jgi:hypothetical protein
MLYDIEPWGDERSDLAAGGLVAATVAVHGGEPKPPSAYMPLLKKPKSKPQSEDSMKAVAAAICAAMQTDHCPDEAN